MNSKASEYPEQDDQPAVKPKPLSKTTTAFIIVVFMLVMGTISFVLSSNSKQYASNEQIEKAYGIDSIVDNQTIMEDEFLSSQYNPDEGRDEALVCKRPTKGEVKDMPKLDCYVPPVEREFK